MDAGRPIVREVRRPATVVEAWDALVAAARPASPFVAGWWVAHADPRPLLVVVEDDEGLIGGVALGEGRVAGVRRLRALGEGVGAPDHADVVVAPGRRDAVIEALRDWFRTAGAVVDVVGVRADSTLAEVVPGARQVAWSSAPYRSLVGDGPPEPGSSRVRNSARRARRRLDKRGYEHRVVGAGADLGRALDDLLALHRLRWPDGSNFARTFDQLRPALEAGAEAGAVSVHESVVEGAVVASMLAVDQPDRCSYYQSGRRMEHEWRGIGTVLMADVVADAHRRGMTEFDFLRGREPYKLDWTDTERPLVRLVGGAGWRARVVAVGLASYERAKPTLRRGRDRAQDAIEQWRTRRAERSAAAATPAPPEGHGS